MTNLPKARESRLFFLALLMIFANATMNVRLSFSGSELESEQNQIPAPITTGPSQPPSSSLEIEQQHGSSSTHLKTPQQQNSSRSQRQRTITDWPSTLSGCWQRTPRRSECNTQITNASNVPCQIPKYFHLQEICFDEQSRASAGRVIESHSHMDRSEGTVDDSNDHMISAATIQQTR